MALLEPEFPAHLEIGFALHLEILCWFRFWSKAGGSCRGWDAAQPIKIRIERVNAACKLQASDRWL
jgi:hypothetical protein